MTPPERHGPWTLHGAAPDVAYAARALQAKVEQQNEWYGLDNWSYREVVEFVKRHLEQHAALLASEQALEGAG